MKVAVIGASAHSTPALFDSTVRFDDLGVRFALVARSRERLGAVSRAIGLINAHRSDEVLHEVVHIDDLEAAVDEASVVIVQIRTGGHAARNWDESFPLNYGQCGDEGLGMGGLAAAWRTWPDLRALLSRIASTGTRAHILLLTSPVGILTRCALHDFPQLNIYGICELPWTTVVNMCSAPVFAASSLTFSYLGVNHLGWLSNVKYAGRTVLDASGVMPLKYVALADDRQLVLSQQRAKLSRAIELAHHSTIAFGTYAQGSLSEILTVVRSRATPWYAEAVVPFIAGIAGEACDRSFFLTHRNEGYCPDLSDDAVVEMPFAMRSGRLERQPLTLWERRDITERVRSLVQYEVVATDAVLRRDGELLGAAIRSHPWLGGFIIDRRLMEDVVAEPPPIEARSYLTKVAS
jgi:6-phospho-beta-glucosidase